MRIAIITDDFEDIQGGIEYQALRLAEALQSLGHHVDRVAPGEVRIALRQGYDWVLFEGIHRAALLAYLIHGRQSGQTRFCLAPHGSFITRTRSRDLNLLEGYRSDPWNHLQAAFDWVMMGQILRSMSLIFTLSHAEALDLHTLFGIPTKILHTLPLLITEPELKVGDKSIDALVGQSPYFITISRIDRRKNVVAAVRAAFLAGARLFVVGQDRGDLVSVLREINRIDSPSIRYLGSLPDSAKTSLLSRATALVIPSYFEGLPAVMLEARRLGTRVISTRINYAPPMNEVYLCDPTPRAIADLMGYVSHLSPHPTSTILPSESEVAAKYLELFEAKV